MRGAGTSDRALLPFWWAALLCFSIAALTGVLFRATTLWPGLHELSLTNVRHAHSHLMFFGWVTPAFMLLVAARTAAMRGERVSRATGHVIGATLTLGVVSHPLFLRFGYSAATIGSARLPLSVMIAGLNMIAWYAFVRQHARETRGMTRTPALFAWDLALAMLVFSSAGAWGLALVRPLGLDVERATAIGMHLFLDPFSEGWLVLAALGLAHHDAGVARGRRSTMVAIAVTSALGFGLAVPRGVVPDALRWVSAAAGVVWSLALLVELSRVWRAPAGRALALPLAIAVLAALARLVASATPWLGWTSLAGLRLVYLHALMLGFVTLVVVTAARRTLGAHAVPSVRAFEVAAVALVATLVPLSEAWPSAWQGRWAFVLATIGAALAAGTGLVSLAVGVARSSLRSPEALSESGGLSTPA